MSTKIVFVVEKTGTGFSAYAENFEANPVGTTGKTFLELKNNIVDAMNTYRSHINGEEVTEDDISIELDLPQVFEYYDYINATALSKRIGINQSLLSQYVNGNKKPSPKQLTRILAGIREVGKELSSFDLIIA